MIEAARDYAAHGWRVFALNGKVPFAGTRGFKDATTDPSTVERWPAGANVGIATGAGLVVVDIDYLHDGGESLRELERQHGTLPPTASVETGGGGAHYYFSARVPVGCSVGTLGDGIDVRGELGYIVAPPSVHPNGRPYAWDNHPDDVPLAELPGWLERLLTERQGGRARRPVSEWRALAADGTVEGERNQRAAQLGGHLLGRGVDPYVTLELLVAWDQHRNRPPLGRGEVARVVESIAAREAAKWTG